MRIVLNEQGRGFAERIGRMVGQNLDGCYQCGKCTAGCPIAYEMDLLPHEVMRLVQLGQEEEILSSHTIWLCASCETCTARCPKNIEVTAVMDALRVLAFRRERGPAEKEIALFHRLFLQVVERFGRVSDLHLMGRFNLKTRRPLRDWRLGRKLWAKGKLKLSAPAVREAKQVREIFRRVRDQGERP